MRAAIPTMVVALCLGCGSAMAQSAPETAAPPATEAVAPPAAEASTQAAAQSPAEASAQAAAESPPLCQPGPDMLGVSRTVEIDTTGGALFGEQYPPSGLLQDGEVVLTFDDGPLRRYTLPVLQALDSQCTKATFFVVGQMAVADPDVLKETARRGHTIGTHTWSHRNVGALGAAAGQKEIELGVSAISKALGAPVSPFFRFPYLGDSKSSIDYIKGRNFGIFSIDIDTKDYTTRNAGQVQRRVLAALEKQKKGIILFHDIQGSTARAIKSLLGELKKRGYKIVQLTAKQTAPSLPEYDAVAEALLARKTLAAAHNPLATRSIVWPVEQSAAGVEGAEPSIESAKPPRERSRRRASSRGRRRSASAESGVDEISFQFLSP